MGNSCSNPTILGQTVYPFFNGSNPKSQSFGYLVEDPIPSELEEPDRKLPRNPLGYVGNSMSFLNPSSVGRTQGHTSGAFLRVFSASSGGKTTQNTPLGGNVLPSNSVGYLAIPRTPVAPTFKTVLTLSDDPRSFAYKDSDTLHGKGNTMIQASSFSAIDPDDLLEKDCIGYRVHCSQDTIVSYSTWRSGTDADSHARLVLVLRAGTDGKWAQYAHFDLFFDNTYDIIMTKGTYLAIYSLSVFFESPRPVSAKCGRAPLGISSIAFPTTDTVDLPAPPVTFTGIGSITLSAGGVAEGFGGSVTGTWEQVTPALFNGLEYNVLVTFPGGRVLTYHMHYDGVTNPTIFTETPDGSPDVQVVYFDALVE
jgi:hypothetical protein